MLSVLYVVLNSEHEHVNEFSLNIIHFDIIIFIIILVEVCDAVNRSAKTWLLRIEFCYTKNKIQELYFRKQNVNMRVNVYHS